MTAPEPVFIDTTGLQLATYDWRGDGPPVLLVHPTGFHGRVWGPTAALLREAGYHPYSFDVRGHGDSQRGGPLRGWDGFADDTLAVVDHFGIGNDPALIAAGHSKGAAALLLAEYARPGTFNRIWAFEPITFLFDGPLPAAENFPLAVGAKAHHTGVAGN